MGERMSYDPRLTLIQDALSLLEEESVIFASPEDILYFRTFAKQKIESPQETKIVTQKPPEEPEPPPIPPPSAKQQDPIAVKKEEPPPPEWRSDAPIAIEPLNFASLKSVFWKIFPQIALLDEIPDDAIAKKTANRWKTKNQIAPISILYFSEPPKQKALLLEIAKAIDVYFGPARLIDAEAIEKEKQWETFLSSDTLKLVIACDYTLWQLNNLMRHYKEIPSGQTRTLGNIPLLLLPDLSLYLKDPLLKRSLWKAICKAVSAHS